MGKTWQITLKATGSIVEESDPFMALAKETCDYLFSLVIETASTS